jgi:hypothetical protein
MTNEELKIQVCEIVDDLYDQFLEMKEQLSLLHAQVQSLRPTPLGFDRVAQMMPSRAVAIDDLMLLENKRAEMRAIACDILKIRGQLAQEAAQGFLDDETIVFKFPT